MSTNRRTILSLIVLTLLVATFGRIVYVRGLGLRMYHDYRTVEEAVTSWHGSPIVAVSMRILRTLYTWSPSYGPFNHETEAMERSLRVASATSSRSWCCAAGR